MAMNILVVEDEKKIAAFIRKGLDEQGYSLTISHNGDEGYRLAQTKSFDLIILDIMLPKLDGFEVLSRLRQGKQSKDIPIIMLTASGEAKHIKAGMDKGADAYLAKPFKSTVLLGIIKGLLGK